VYRADTEILFTDAFVRLGVTLKFGKLDPTAFDPAWNFSREIGGRDPVTVFDEVLNSGDISTVLDSIAPSLPGYPRLRRALADYRVILAQGGWTQVPDGPTLELGSNGSRVVALRDRLKVTGDLQSTDPTGPTVFDAALDAAVKRFQQRHGVTADGRVGQRSLEELNVPVEARIDQIRANLERARWVFRDIEDSYIIADIAGYRLDLVEEGERSWSTNVQVGKPYHATPVFKSRLQYIEFNPTWTIPPGILRNEILPAIRRDTSYLSRNNMSVVTNSGTIVDPTTIDWAATAEGGFPYIIRQEPGTRNALGQVKFIFPNKYAVYLHDTPSRGLFARTERAFSHGCIRTQNPFDLAERLLDDQGWDRARVDSVTESRETTRVYLETPVTVMLLYWTAQADADGTVHFRKDLYDRDARIIEGLAEPFRVDPPEGVGGSR
jgi:murein L,D-transpeptidase YcbB/YkuD